MNNTRRALLEQGALLYATRGVTGVTARELHKAAGAKNASALHYHFGSQTGLLRAIIEGHMTEMERVRKRLVQDLEATHQTADIRALVSALASPLLVPLGTSLGRAHLVLLNHDLDQLKAFDLPFAYEKFPAGAQIVQWLRKSLPRYDNQIMVHRLIALRSLMIGQFAFRAQLLEVHQHHEFIGDNRAFLENLVDCLVAGLVVEPSDLTMAAATPTPQLG